MKETAPPAEVIPENPGAGETFCRLPARAVLGLFWCSGARVLVRRFAGGLCTVGLARAERQLASQSSRRAGKRCGAVRGRRPLGSRPPFAFGERRSTCDQPASIRPALSLADPLGLLAFFRFDAARLERFAPRAAIQREVRPRRGRTETSSSRLAR